MNLVSITPVRNEEWIIGFSLRAMLMWVDSAVVLLHACTDRSAEIVREVASETGRVELLEENNPDWHEMAHRQKLLDAARAREATHIAMVDSDEVLCGDLLTVIRSHIQRLPLGSWLQVPLPCLWGSLETWAVSAPSRHGQYRCDWGRSVTSVAFADSPRLCWRRRDNYDHHSREPMHSRPGLMLTPPGRSGLMHLQFASRRRLVAKHALYKVTERLKYPWKLSADIDALYNLAINPSCVELAPVPQSWWMPYDALLHCIDLDAEPWHEAEVRRLYDKHAPQSFRGLDLFGLVPTEVNA